METDRHHRSLRIHSIADGRVSILLEQIPDTEDIDAAVTVRVRYSSINYKDALAVTGRGKIIRGELPFVPGIDLAGEVVTSSDPRFAPGDRVVGTGGGLGETISGGYSEIARPSPDHLVHIPDAFSFEEAMAIGTAGFTAMLSLMALDEGQVDKAMPVLVTGATGGVGSVAVALLARNGYDVVASTGKESAHDYLRALGAGKVIHRDELSDGPRRPMDSATWGGAVDTVGGKTLATVISRLGWRATVAACGNASGAELETTVFPFILRGVKMIGIDSNMSPRSERQTAWRRLSEELSLEMLDSMYKVIDLNEVEDACAAVLGGEVQGRLVVKVSE